MVPSVTGTVTTQVPMTIVHSKDFTPGSTEADGRRRPLLFRSYGAYGTDVDLSYHEPYLSLLSRGWTIAYAHIRFVRTLLAARCTLQWMIDLSHFFWSVVAVNTVTIGTRTAV
jgi:hypothetical protein